MGEFVRTFTFRGINIPRDTKFLLTFDASNIPGVYETVFPVVWKVTSPGAGPPPLYTYVQKFGFTRAVSGGGVLDPASTYTHINVGQETELSKITHPWAYRFSTPQTIIPPTKHSVATNVTNGLEDIGFGFFERNDRPPSPVLFFENVKAGHSVHSEFTPILKGYVTSGYRENEIIRGELATPSIFKENLMHLPEHSDWLLKYDSDTGRYTIERGLLR